LNPDPQHYCLVGYGTYFGGGGLFCVPVVPATQGEESRCCGQRRQQPAQPHTAQPLEPTTRHDCSYRCSLASSVEDPVCLSRIPHPDFCPSRIPDPKTATKERAEKYLQFYLFCSHKNHKIENYINFELVKKKIWVNLERIIELSEIRDTEKTYSGSRIQGPKRHRIPDPDPQHCLLA
jgi:hypothetical protein